jgi:hypothetical protein
MKEKRFLMAETESFSGTEQVFEQARQANRFFSHTVGIRTIDWWDLGHVFTVEVKDILNESVRNGRRGEVGIGSERRPLKMVEMSRGDKVRGLTGIIFV